MAGILLFAEDMEKVREFLMLLKEVEYIQFFRNEFFQLYLEAPENEIRKIHAKARRMGIKFQKLKPFKKIYGKRVIVIGGGAQVSQVVHGAISEADRHNLRGELISVDTIPLVGEEKLADAIRAVGRLHRAAALVLAGSIMGGEATLAVKELRKEHGIPVISLNMAGSLPKECDLVVTDPVQAGVMAVMAIADTAKFDLKKLRRKKF
jgi:energy-converting hydrogenase B subunit Q